MNFFFLFNFFAVSLFFSFSSVLLAQTSLNGQNNNYLPVAVPFLTIAPDARSGAMGEIGAATSADANSLYWNAAKLAFVEKRTVSISYSPWLRRLLPASNLAYLNYVSPIDERNALGASLRYFNAGQSDLYDENTVGQGTYHPVEFSIDGAWARKFGGSFSMSLSARYIYSRLGNGSSQNAQLKPGQAVACDVGFYYRIQTQQFEKDTELSFGVNISNLGTKMNYALENKYFLPANLRLGMSSKWFFNEISELTFAIDINKLLVPSPPIRNSDGAIIAGRDDNRSAVSGIFGSFNDAPGGMREELKEINWGGGLEYWYNKQLALRTGYFYENPMKGNRQYLTIGMGLIFKGLSMDFSYLIADQQKSPLANTLRFSLAYDF